MKISRLPVPHPSLSPEFRLLCLAARHRQGELEGQALATLITDGIDWPAVIKGAASHRVTALLTSGLRSHPGLAVPADVLETLRQQTMANARRALAQISEVIALNRRLTEAGVPVIVLKGVLLSQHLYGDLSKRGVGDIDFLVDPASFSTAVKVLIADGYRLSHPAGDEALPLSAEERSLTAAYRDLGFDHPERKNHIDLHQRLVANSHQSWDNFPACWEQRESQVLSETQLALLPAHVLPLYLCVHGTYHGWERLCWLADLAVLLETPAARATAIANARAAGLERPLSLALALVDFLLKSDLSEAVSAESPAKRFAHRAYGRRLWWEAPSRGSASWLCGEIQKRWMIYRLKADWRHLRNEIIADLKNPIDHALFRLPAGWTWLYPLLRPVGWVLRNFIRKP